LILSSVILAIFEFVSVAGENGEKLTVVYLAMKYSFYQLSQLLY